VIHRIIRVLGLASEPRKLAKKLRMESLRLSPRLRPWKNDPVFAPLYACIRDRTLVDQRRSFLLYELLRSAVTLPGAIAEVGVYRGGTARLLAQVAGEGGKPVHLFDTFSGMPDTDERDLYIGGDFGDTSLQAVRKLLAGCRNVVFHPGFFPETTRGLEDERFCFVHVDADIAQSVADCCCFFYPRLSSGGFMVFDDYGFKSCPGAKLSVDAFFENKVERPIRLTTTQCFVVKR